MLASKFFDDVYYNNAYYARVGGISNGEVNALEMEMLRMISFSLFVQPEQYERYRSSLYSHVQPPGGTATQVAGGTIDLTAAPGGAATATHAASTAQPPHSPSQPPQPNFRHDCRTTEAALAAAHAHAQPPQQPPPSTTSPYGTAAFSGGGSSSGVPTPPPGGSASEASAASTSTEAAQLAIAAAAAQQQQAAAVQRAAQVVQQQQQAVQGGFCGACAASAAASGGSPAAIPQQSQQQVGHAAARTPPGLMCGHGGPRPRPHLGTPPGGAGGVAGGGGGMYCAPGGGLVSTAPMAIPQPNLQYHNPYTAQAQQVPGGGGAAQPIPIRPTVQTGFHPTGNQPDVSDPMVE